MPSWKHIHSALVIVLIASTGNAQFSEVWTNGDLYATETFAAEAYSGAVERCYFVGVTPDEPSWFDYITGKNRAKLVSVKNNIKACIPYFINPSVSNILMTLQSEGVQGLTWSNEVMFLDDIGLPTNSLDETPFFKLQYVETTGGWHSVKTMIQSLVRTKVDVGYWPRTNITSEADFDITGYGNGFIKVGEVPDNLYSNLVLNKIGAASADPYGFYGGLGGFNLQPGYDMLQSAHLNGDFNTWTNFSYFDAGAYYFRSYDTTLETMKQGVINCVSGKSLNEFPERRIVAYSPSWVWYDTLGLSNIGYPTIDPYGSEAKSMILQTFEFGETVWPKIGIWGNNYLPNKGRMSSEAPHMITGDSAWSCTLFYTNWLGGTNQPVITQEDVVTNVLGELEYYDIIASYYVTNTTTNTVTNSLRYVSSTDYSYSFLSLDSGLFQGGHAFIPVTNITYATTNVVTFSNDITNVSNDYELVTVEEPTWEYRSVAVTNTGGTNFTLTPLYPAPCKAGLSMAFQYDIIKDLPTNINHSIDTFAYVDVPPATNTISYWFNEDTGTYGGGPLPDMQGYVNTFTTSFDNFGFGYTNGWNVTESTATNSSQYYFGRLWGTNSLPAIGACEFPDGHPSNRESRYRGWIVTENFAAIWWDFKYK